MDTETYADSNRGFVLRKTEPIKASPIRDGQDRVAHALDELDKTVGQVLETFVDLCHDTPETSPDRNEAEKEYRGGSNFAQMLAETEARIISLNNRLRRLLRDAEI